MQLMCFIPCFLHKEMYIKHDASQLLLKKNLDEWNIWFSYFSYPYNWNVVYQVLKYEHHEFHKQSGLYFMVSFCSLE